MAKGKALRFPKNHPLKECLADARAHWMERHTEIDADGNRSFRGNNKYTPFQAKRGDELLVFVWGGGKLTMFRAAESVECGPRLVWEE